MKRGTYEILEFKTRREIKPWVRPILALMNECYMAENIYGYAPLEEQEMDDLARRFLPILDPRFVKAIRKDGEVVAFIIAMPDMTEGIVKARGRLLPFGFFRVLRAARKTKQLDLLLGAIKEKYRGQGLDRPHGHQGPHRGLRGRHGDDRHPPRDGGQRQGPGRDGGDGRQVYKKFRAFYKML